MGIDGGCADSAEQQTFYESQLREHLAERARALHSDLVVEFARAQHVVGRQVRALHVYVFALVADGMKSWSTRQYIYL